MAHETLLTIFTIIAALAVVLQAVAMVGVYKAIRAMHGEVSRIRTDLEQRFDPLIDSVTQMITDARDPLDVAISNLAEISKTVRDSAQSIDQALNEVLDKFRTQVHRVDQTVSDLIDKVQTTSAVVQRSVAGPVQEIAALMKGVQAGMDFILARRRAGQASETTQDEQMFI
jgi:methyl-accepting chemotaxis protein